MMLKILILISLKACVALAETSSIQDVRPEPSHGIPKEAFGIIVVLVLMMLSIVILYIKFRRLSRTESADTAKHPVILQASIAEPTPIVKVEVEKLVLEAKYDIVAHESKSINSQVPNTNQGKPFATLDFDQAGIAIKSFDENESRKNSDPERSFRKFRLRSLSDGDSALHILDAGEQETQH